jgi:hypothetical protein
LRHGKTLGKLLKTGSLSFAMSLAEVMEEIPRLTFGQRQELIRRAVELDDPQLSPIAEALVDKRLAAHHEDPSSSLSLDEGKAHMRRRRSK